MECEPDIIRVGWAITLMASVLGTVGMFLVLLYYAVTRRMV